MRIALVMLALLLGACQTIERVPVRPNPALTRDCEYPTLDGDTWRDLAQAYERRGEALKECSARMRAIRSGEI
jgi:predicted secreted Zn-dependent protease